MPVFTEEKEENFKRLDAKPFRQIFKYALKHWYLLIVAILSLAFTSFFDASFTPLMNNALVTALETQAGINGPLDEFIIHVDLIFGIAFDVNFTMFAIIFLSLMLGRCISIFFTFFIADVISMEIMNELRLRSFEKVQQLSFSYFDKTPTGWILARMQNDTSSVSEMLAWGVLRICWTSFEIAFLLVTMFTKSWQLTIIILATTPLIIIATPIFQHFLLKFHRIARNAYSNYVRWLSECINGVATIKTLSIEDSVYYEAESVVDDIRKKYKRAMILQSYFGPFVNLISYFTVAGLILICYPVLDGGQTFIAGLVVDAGIFILFTNSVEHIYSQFADFSELYNEFVANQASAEKIVSLINQVPELVDSPDVIEKYGTLLEPKIENYEPIEGDIKFENVSFSYLKDTEVIHNLNLHIKKGTSVAIVGETGSGKTTTVNLLCRFYQPTSGDILIDDVPYRNRSVGWLRNSISYIQQNPFVFSGSYRDNITFGNREATDEEIINASKLVGLDEFVSSQKDGYNTYLADGGNQLSVGQKQLVSFTRAILKNPRILILDEATSSIDTESESIVQNAMEKILKGRTSIIIAHRLSTIVNCDRILLMENGVIVEDGSHKELMAKKGKYFNLYMSQFRELNVSQQIEVYEKEQKLK